MEGSNSHKGMNLRLRPVMYEDYEIRKKDFQLSSKYGDGITYRVPHWYYLQIAMML